MTVSELADKLGFTIKTEVSALSREVRSVYCCDLLSIVMGRAPADSAWVTVMSSINALAVSALTDTACVIVAEDVMPDEASLKKAAEQDIAVLTTPLPVFDAALLVHEAIK